jgi:WNK lysine deficient protein kinase
MRARTTWNPEQILQRTSATNRVADPYAMNQDHLKQQPSADKYLTGDPSAFAEDITTPNEWNPEYSGGAVKRDEIGMPELRPETFNHPEKTASVNHEAVLKKANIATQIARRLLGANATEIAVEEQAAALMHLPDQEIVNTANRLAGELPPALKEHMEKEQGGQAAKKEEAGQDQGQEQQKQAALALAGGDPKVAAALMIMMGTLKKGNDPQQQAPMQQQGQAQQQSAQDQQSAWYDSKGQRPGHQGPDTGPYAGQQQAQQQMPVQQQAQQQMPVQQQAQQAPQQMPMQQQGQGQQQNIEAEVQQMIQQAAQQQVKQANGQQQMPMQQQGQQQMPVQQQAGQQQQAQCPPMAQQQMPVQQQATQQQFPGGQFPTAQQQMPVQASDDQLIDQMLMPGGAQTQGAPIAEMDIQMEAPNMDIGDVQFAPGEDAMLKQLFASGDEAQAAQQAQEAQQGQAQQQGQVQANIRTAALRTFGTRPTAGVSRIGGAGAPPSRGAEVDKLTSLWQSAPDVREAFGLKTT